VSQPEILAPPSGDLRHTGFGSLGSRAFPPLHFFSPVRPPKSGSEIIRRVSPGLESPVPGLVSIKNENNEGGNNTLLKTRGEGEENVYKFS
jgi:hypothetical protein